MERRRVLTFSSSVLLFVGEGVGGEEEEALNMKLEKIVERSPEEDMKVFIVWDVYLTRFI